MTHTDLTLKEIVLEDDIEPSSEEGEELDTVR